MLVCCSWGLLGLWGTQDEWVSCYQLEGYQRNTTDETLSFCMAACLRWWAALMAHFWLGFERDTGETFGKTRLCVENKRLSCLDAELGVPVLIRHVSRIKSSPVFTPRLQLTAKSNSAMTNYQCCLSKWPPTRPAEGIDDTYSLS